MTVRIFLVTSSLATVLSWVIWLLIINFLDPTQAGALGFFLFYLALLLAIASTSSLIGYGIRRLLGPGLVPAYAVRAALRQGILFGIFLDLLLLLQRLGLYRWWLAIVMIILFLSVEFIFLGYDQAARRAAKQSRQTSKPGT